MYLLVVCPCEQLRAFTCVSLNGQEALSSSKVLGADVALATGLHAALPAHLLVSRSRTDPQNTRTKMAANHGSSSSSDQPADPPGLPADSPHNILFPGGVERATSPRWSTRLGSFIHRAPPLYRGSAVATTAPHYLSPPFVVLLLSTHMTQLLCSATLGG